MEPRPTPTKTSLANIEACQTDEDVLDTDGGVLDTCGVSSGTDTNVLDTQWGVPDPSRRLEACPADRTPSTSQTLNTEHHTTHGRP